MAITKKTRPLILVIPCRQAKGAEFEDLSLSLSDRYALAIQAGGGVPLVAPLSLSERELAQCTAQVDGVMLTGGDDVQPDLYEPEMPARLKRKSGAADARRDWLEIALIQEVFRQRKPLLAICRGHQILNVAMGGSLYVDIATEVPKALNHRQMSKSEELVHRVQLAPRSRLAKIARSLAMDINSCHHQAVKELARPFEATAQGEDGVIEAFELAPGEAGLMPYLLAVQFHPERLYHRDEVSRRIFCDFIRACRRVG